MKKHSMGLSIFLRLLISFLSVVIVISSALTTVFYVYNKRSLEKHTMENILQQFEAIDYHLRFEMQEQLLNNLQILSSNPSVDTFMMSSELEKEINARGMERLFLESLKYINSYDRIYYIDSLGKETIKVDRTGRIKQFSDMSRSALFTSLQGGLPGSIHFETPRKETNGLIHFTIGIGKLDPDIGKFGGAILIDYNLDWFFTYISKIKMFDENPIWIFDKQGGVLQQPKREKATLDPRPYFSIGIQDETRIINLSDGMLVYRDFVLLPQQPLLRLAISIPSSLMLGDILQVLRFFIIVFVLSLLVISLIAYYLSGYLSKPITELAHAASRISQGDSSAQVRVKTSGEVQMLVDSFNRMAENLQQTTVSKVYVDNIIRSMMDTLIVVTPDRRIIQVNRAGCRLLEYAEEDLIGQPVDKVIEHDSTEYASVVDEVLSKGSIENNERVYRTRSGKRVPMLFAASILRDTQAAVELLRIICVAQDITDRKQDEEMLKAYSEELKVINDELKSFAYIISHDLRAPLVNIKGFSDELVRALGEIEPCFQKHFNLLDQTDREKVGPVLHKDIPEALTFIGSSVSRMDSIINSVLQLSRAGRRKLTSEPVIMNELVQTVVNSLAHQIGSRSVSLMVRDLPDVDTDKTAMEQIFGNLLDNAVKYLDAGRAGEVEVSAERNGLEIIYHVRDNGRGMAKEDIPRSFEIFRRVGRQDVPGEGMGLAYVKTLVRSLGGRIWCESEPGVGTRFSFALPRNSGDVGGQIPAGGRV